MPPVVNNESFKTKMIVKRLLSKLKNKEKIKMDSKDEIVTDSVPDYACEDKPGGDPSQPTKNEENGQTHHKNTCEIEEVMEDDEKKEEEQREKTRKPEERFKKSSQDRPPKTTYNIENAGTVHIGTTIKTINNFTQINNLTSKPKKSKSPKVEALLQSKVRLGMDHVEFLSDHFGLSCREIGLSLGLTSGQLDLIENDCGANLKQISFEVMQLWMRKMGENATVGNLCAKLWKSKIARAREAVTQLSEVINQFN